METSLSCIIVEDEPLAQERIIGYLQKIPSLRLDAVFDSGVEALVHLKTRSVDLVFLDINMGEFSGIQLLESAGIKCQVIIITAYHEYAVKGYELNVTDYLLKPFTFERFMSAVGKAMAALTPVQQPAARKYIFIKTEYRLEKILFDEILYIEGMRDYRKIVTTGKSIMTLQTFRDLEQEIPSEIVCRVHKSYMVALGKIDSIEKDTIVIGPVSIPISDTYKEEFYRLVVYSTRQPK